jgi:hypothetical protein
MTRRLVRAAIVGTIIGIAWAVLRSRPVVPEPEAQPWDIPPWDVTTTSTTTSGATFRVWMNSERPN